MIIAHLPAGYLVAKAWVRCVPAAVPAARLVAAGMIGGVIPDIDMFWSVLVDHGAVHHHRYPTHWPAFWFAVIPLLVLASRLAGVVGYGMMLGVFSLAVASHLFLDSIASAMWLCAPFSDRSFQMIHIPAQYRPWVLNFVFHWVGLLDVAIAALGGVVWLGSRSGCESGRITGQRTSAA